MRTWGCCAYAVAALATALWGSSAAALEIQRLDGLHRIEKKAQITAAAVLRARDGDSDEVCGTSMQLCAASLSGGCCPDNYMCAKESCYATTQGPATCGTKVGWQVCAAVYGGGCCPDGYMCQTAGNCVPPSGSPYTFGCPTSQYLCPSSLSYGCCPNGMGCAVNQCYSTEPTTETTTMVITTTEHGSRETITSTATTVRPPEMPTTLPTSAAAAGDEQVFKYFPSAVAKVSPTMAADGGGGGGGGLSTGALAGIVTGAVVFLIIVAVIAYIIIRHLNKVVAAVTTSKHSQSSKSRPQMKEFKPTDSQVDGFSVDPLMMVSPRPSHPRRDSSSEAAFGPTSEDPLSATPSSFAGGYQPISPEHRHASLESGANAVGYFDAPPGRPSGVSQRSSVAAPYSVRGSGQSQASYAHVRSYSTGSDPPSDVDASPGMTQPMAMELDSRPWVPELADSSPPSLDERRRSGGSGTGVMSRPPMAYQRRSDGRTSPWGDAQAPLTSVHEEAHAYQSISGRITGPGELEPGELSIPADEIAADTAAAAHHHPTAKSEEQQ